MVKLFIDNLCLLWVLNKKMLCSVVKQLKCEAHRNNTMCSSFFNIILVHIIQFLVHITWSINIYIVSFIVLEAKCNEYTKTVSFPQAHSHLTIDIFTHITHFFLIMFIRLIFVKWCWVTMLDTFLNKSNSLSLTLFSAALDNF